MCPTTYGVTGCTEHGSIPNSVESLAKAFVAAEAALERKAYDLIVIESEHLAAIADYFLIATGRSDTQVQAIVRGIEERMTREGARLLSTEGFNNARWVVLDYDDVVVHIFCEPARDFYRLERTWGDAREVSLPERIRAQAESLRIDALA